MLFLSFAHAHIQADMIFARVACDEADSGVILCFIESSNSAPCTATLCGTRKNYDSDRFARPVSQNFAQKPWSHQTRMQGGKIPPKNFFAPLEKCVGHSLKQLDSFKNLSPFQKTLRPTWCLKLVTILGHTRAIVSYRLILVA